MGGYWQEACKDAGCRQSVAEYYNVAFCDNREAFIATLRRDEKIRRFHFLGFTSHVMTNWDLNPTRGVDTVSISDKALIYRCSMLGQPL